MTTNDLFDKLISHPESDTLDFKEAMYDLSGDGKYDLIKDVICLANTPRDGSAHIVIGVRWKAGDPPTLLGLGSQIDDAMLLDHLAPTRFLPSPPTVRYHPLNPIRFT
jgi:hypothetical protein